MATKTNSRTARKPAGKSARGDARPTFTDAQLDKVVKLRGEGVPWDGEKGVCAAIGATSAIPIRRALRHRGGKYAAVAPQKAKAKTEPKPAPAGGQS